MDNTIIKEFYRYVIAIDKKDVLATVAEDFAYYFNTKEEAEKTLAERKENLKELMSASGQSIPELVEYYSKAKVYAVKINMVYSFVEEGK